MNKNDIYLTVKDFSVSGEEFQLVYNSQLDILETQPQPTEDQLPNYYKSDDYISHTDGKRNWFEKLYQAIKSIALKRKLKLINSFGLNGKQLLDIGCGTGDFLKIAQENNWNISGIEPNPEARALANNKTINSVFDVDELSRLPKDHFDVITLWHVLEHLPKLENHLSIFESLLKSNGRLVIAVPNYKSFDANYYKNYWAAYDVPRHLWHFSRNSFSKIIAGRSFNIENILPMTFDAFYVSLLSEKYKNGFMNPFKAFWIGWRSNQKAKHSGEYSSLIYVIKKS